MSRYAKKKPSLIKTYTGRFDHEQVYVHELQLIVNWHRTTAGQQLAYISTNEQPVSTTYRILLTCKHASYKEEMKRKGFVLDVLWQAQVNQRPEEGNGCCYLHVLCLKDHPRHEMKNDWNETRCKKSTSTHTHTHTQNLCCRRRTASIIKETVTCFHWSGQQQTNNNNNNNNVYWF